MSVDIVKDLKKYLPIFQQAYDQGINEAETSLRISKFFEEVLGYDVFSEISREHVVKDRNVDYAIKLNGKVKFFIEVKQAGIALKERHIEQAENYAANSGVPWVLLTSGRYWQLYHLTFDEGIQSDLIWSVDILGDDVKAAAEKLSLLHKKSIAKGEIEDFYAKVKTLSPRSVVQAIFHESTLKMIRACLKNSTGVRVDEQELADNIKKMISQDAWEVIGDVKITRRRKSSKPKVKEGTAAQQPVQNTPESPPK
jgi:predicted type IV restriction endonuclease